MAVTISPVGLGAAPVANTLAFMATYRERLEQPYCVNSSVQPQVSVTYRTGTARLSGTTVFVPVTAVITIVTPTGCGRCNARTQVQSESFVVAVQGQTGLPTSVTLTEEGRDVYGSDVACGRVASYTINDSLVLVITPPAAG